MSESWKVAAIKKVARDSRRARENEDPEMAAEYAARVFERGAIVIPPSLAVPPDTNGPVAQAYEDAAALYRDLAIEPNGLLLTKTGVGMGKNRRAGALRVLRASGAVRETKEDHPNAGGRVQPMIVLRAVPAEV